MKRLSVTPVVSHTSSKTGCLRILLTAVSACVTLENKGDLVAAKAGFAIDKGANAEAGKATAEKKVIAIAVNFILQINMTSSRT